MVATARYRRIACEQNQMTFNAPFRFLPCVIVMLAGLPQTLHRSLLLLSRGVGLSVDKSRANISGTQCSIAR